MRQAVQHTIILLGLCSIFFYSGYLLIGETEARFTSQVKAEQVVISIHDDLSSTEEIETKHSIDEQEALHDKETLNNN